MPNRALGTVTVICYGTVIVLANWLIRRFGIVHVWPWPYLMPAGTYAAGFAFVFRNLTQETLGRWPVLAAITAGAALSAWVAGPRLAFASGFTFAAAEFLDFTVYTPLRKRGWKRAALAGNCAGLVADTFLFLTLAGYGFALVPGQLIGKAYATAFYLGTGALIMRRRAVQPA